MCINIQFYIIFVYNILETKFHADHDIRNWIVYFPPSDPNKERQSFNEPKSTLGKGVRL